MTQHQQQQPLTEHAKTALLLIAAGDIQGLREVKLSSAAILLERDYIKRSTQPAGPCLILTRAGRELIPTLCQHQAS